METEASQRSQTAGGSYVETHRTTSVQNQSSKIGKIPDNNSDVTLLELFKRQDIAVVLFKK
jgi:hypothetical protein